jgi:hypothetical protein
MKPTGLAICVGSVFLGMLAGCSSSRMDVTPRKGPDAAPDSTATSPSNGGPDSAPDVQADSGKVVPRRLNLTGLTALSIDISGGMPSPRSIACATPTTYAVDLPSQTLSWTFCDDVPGSTNSYLVNRGSRPLSTDEMRALNMVLANHLTPDYRKTCGSDKASEKLTLTFADHTDTYWDDFYAGCSSDTAKQYIHNMDTLISFLGDAAKVATVPTEFETLEIDVQRSSPQTPHTWTDCQLYYDSQYTIDSATRTLKWSLCRSSSPGAAFTPVTGSLSLSAADFGNIVAGLGKLVLGASGDCTTVRPDVTLSVYRDQHTTLFRSDVSACASDFDQEPLYPPHYVIGLDALAATVAKLAEPTP